jgi:hypothetical protein
MGFPHPAECVRNLHEERKATLKIQRAQSHLSNVNLVAPKTIPATWITSSGSVVVSSIPSSFFGSHNTPQLNEADEEGETSSDDGIVPATTSNSASVSTSVVGATPPNLQSGSGQF